MDKCKICDNTFPRKYRKKGIKQIYCSKKCRYKDAYSNKTCLTCKKTFEHNFFSKKSILFCTLSCMQRNPCELCGIIIKGRNNVHGKTKKFCSRSCSAFFHRTMKAKVSYVPNGFCGTIKKLGKICCEKCGQEDLQVLCVHHINKNRRDNSMENLQTLCANCHHREHWKDSATRKKHIMLAYLLSKQI